GFHFLAFVHAVTFGSYDHIIERIRIGIQQKYVPEFLPEFVFFYGNRNGYTFYRFKFNMLFHGRLFPRSLRKAATGDATFFLLLRPLEFRGPVLFAWKLRLYR